MNLATDSRWLGYAALGLVIIGNAAGNVLLKLGADIARQQGGLLALLNWQTITGVACFALGILAYSWSLQQFQLHSAQIVVSLQYALVILLAWLVLGERLTPTQWFGIAFIAFGIFLCTRSHA
ncbi:MAG TPA: DMT family transporter [Rhodanobacteraceae bacterium]|nr:DMT family transporter [Rhodanobacteraceae bacterium]